MNVLFLSPDFLLPADRGLRVRALSQLRVLSSIESVERISLLCLSETEVSDTKLRALEERLPKVKVEAPVVHRSRIRGSPAAALRLARLRLLKREPYVVATCDSPDMHRLVRRHLQSRTYQIAYIGYIGMMAYLSEVRRLSPGAAVVLEQHNVEWQIFERLAARTKVPLRHAVRLEARALRAFERRGLREADAVIAISESDAIEFQGLAGINAVVVPPCIEANGARVEATSAPNLGYIGTLAWQPNAFGLDWFCAEVWPLVRRRLPEATLTIAGPGLRQRDDGTFELPGAWAQPGISAVGFVDDLEKLYRSVLGMVAPVIGGSGVRMKLLETMSAGMPTVTTADGAAGLGIADGREALIASAPHDFADRVVQLLSDAPLRDRLRSGGYAYLGARHSEAIARGRLERAMAEAQARRAPIDGPGALAS